MNNIIPIIVIAICGILSGWYMAWLRVNCIVMDTLADLESGDYSDEYIDGVLKLNDDLLDRSDIWDIM